MRPVPHYLLRDAGGAWPLVALVLNIAFVGFLMGEARTTQTNIKADFVASGTSLLAGSAKTPLLALGAGNKTEIDGRSLGSPAELKSALAKLSQSGTIITIRTAHDTPAQTLSDALQSCGHAGFTKVIFETAPAP